MTLTLQQIFDKAVGGVIAQGMLSTDQNGTCKYEAKNPNTGEPIACAVGQLLDRNARRLWDREGLVTSRSFREIALDSLEGQPSLLRTAHKQWIAAGLPDDDIHTVNLLGRLQSAHDDASTDRFDPMEAFKHNARIVAEDLGLDASIIDKEPAA